jgi:hypothetical protein
MSRRQTWLLNRRTTKHGIKQRSSNLRLSRLRGVNRRVHEIWPVLLRRDLKEDQQRRGNRICNRTMQSASEEEIRVQVERKWRQQVVNDSARADQEGKGVPKLPMSNGLPQ